MINRNVVYQPDGKTYSFHAVKKSQVDEVLGLLRIFTRSFLAETDIQSVEFYIDVFFHEWDQDLLLDPESHLVAGEFKIPAEMLVEIETPKSLKEVKRKQINDSRDSLEKKGFPYMDKMLDSDMQSVSRINTTFSAAMACFILGQPFSIEWTCADNSKLELDAEGMIGMPAALASHAATLHYRANELKDMVDAITSTDIEEVRALLAAIPDS